MKRILAALISFVLPCVAHAQTRNVLVDTNNKVVQPANFWSVDASNARTQLGLGSSATNPASSFQPASSALTNIANSNGGSLTNLQMSSAVGSLAIANGGTGATNAAAARTNLGLGTAATNPSTAFQSASSVLTNLASNNALTLTNIRASNIVGTLSITSAITGTVPIVQGGTGATNSDVARTNLGLGYSALTNTNASNFRTAIGLDSASTNPASAFQPASSVLTNLAANNGGSLTNLAISNTLGVLPVLKGGTGGTNQTQARENLELGSTNSVVFGSLNSLAISGNTLNLGNTSTGDAGTINANVMLVSSWPDLAASAERGFSFKLRAYSNSTTTIDFVDIGQPDFNPQISSVFFRVREVPITLSNSGLIFQGTGAALTRTNLGLSSWVTNTNTPVFVSTNGTVVSPTNLFSAAGFSSFQSFTPTTNSTNTLSASRRFIAFSGATNIGGITISIVLPATPQTGDLVTVVHRGTTSSTTAILSGVSTVTNLSIFNQTLDLVYDGSSWLSIAPDGATLSFNRTNGNVVYGGSNTLTFTNVIGFSTNVSPAIRTNLELGASWLTNTNVTNFRSDIGLSATWLTNTNVTNFRTSIGLSATWLTNTNVTNFRSDIGLGATWLTNTTASNFRTDIGAIGTNVSQSVIFNSNATFNSGVTFNTNVTFASSSTLNVQNAIQMADSAVVKFDGPNGGLYFSNGSEVITRSNLGLNASWLTDTNAGAFRTNIGIPLSVLTNTTVNSFVDAIGFGVTNTITVGSVDLDPNGSGLIVSGAAANLTRTNIGLGGGISTNLTFPDTNGMTHDIIINNGIITQWDVY